MSTLSAQLSLFDAKACSVCGVPKPFSEYYVDDKVTGRRSAHCKACHNEKTLANHRANPERGRSYAKARRDRDISAALERERLSRERNREALRQRDRDRSQTPEYKAKKAAYRLEKREERIAYNKRYREEHAAERKAYNDAYYQANAEDIGKRVRASIAKNPEKYKKIHKDWKAANRDNCIAMAHRRHARERYNGGSWIEADWQRLKATYDWRCLGCGLQEMTDGITLCFDHIIPLSMGGWNLISNGMPLCRSCNSRKHRKVLDLRDRSYPFRKGT